MDVLHQVKQEGQLFRCRRCNREIFDRQMAETPKNSNNFFHNDCLRCSKCSKVLERKYFEACGQMFCWEDYILHYGPKCFGCNNKISNGQSFFSVERSPNQGQYVNKDIKHDIYFLLLIHANLYKFSSFYTKASMHGVPANQMQQRLFFHDNCFACSCCHKIMRRGDKYIVFDNPQKSPVICQDCAIKSNNIDNDSNALNNPTQSIPSATRARRGRMKQTARMA